MAGYKCSSRTASYYRPSHRDALWNHIDTSPWVGKDLVRAETYPPFVYSRHHVIPCSTGFLHLYLAHLNNYSYSICTDISILVLVLYLLYPLVLTLNLVVFRYLVGCHFVGSLYLPGSFCYICVCIVTDFDVGR